MKNFNVQNEECHNYDHNPMIHIILNLVGVCERGKVA
jgi:hypothetical protein